MPNEYVNKVEFGNETLMDITDTTAETGDVLEGQVFYAKSGARSVGTLGDATTSTHGLMSAADKTKLDGITPSDYATLDNNGKVPSSQLPSYVDDVEEYSALASFPATGESGKIYIDTATNITYRWGGSAYVPIGSDLALGETQSTAYRGDRGAAAYAAAVTNVTSSPTSGSSNLITSGGVYTALGDYAPKANPVFTGSISLSRTENTTVGNNSVALGYNVTASGVSSQAEGQNIIASGDYSHAEGVRTQSLTTRTINNTTYSVGAYGMASHIEGAETLTYGFASHAEGNATNAIGTASHAEGTSTIASGGDSHAEGASTQATYSQAHAEGGGTKAINTAAHAEGGGTTASGSSSHAEGGGTTASGGNSHAEGGGTTASGNNSHAEGASSTASGASSHAEGATSVASGNNSHAEGLTTRATGENAHAEGQYTYANGASSHVEGIGYNNSSTTYGALHAADHAEGYQTIANSKFVTNSNSVHAAHAEGTYTQALNDSAHSEGYSTQASGGQSHAEGYGSKATQFCAHAEGYYTYANGLYSHAEGMSSSGVQSSYGANGAADHIEGYYTKANSGQNHYGAHAEGYYTEVVNGSGAHAEGAYTQAKEYASHAEGLSTQASGQCSHAEGNYTTASGSQAHAEGAATIASGHGSHTEGYYTTAKGAYSHVGGKYNVLDSYNNWPEWTANTAYIVGDKVKITTTSNDVTTVQGYICKIANSNSSFTSSNWIDQEGKMNYVEIIGNGINTDRSNARALDWQGNEYLNGDLYVKCNADSSGGVKVATLSDLPSAATTSTAGLMSAADKMKLDELSPFNATDYTVTIETTDWNNNSYTWTNSAVTNTCYIIVNFTESVKTYVKGTIDYTKVTGGVQFNVESTPTGSITLIVGVLDGVSGTSSGSSSGAVNDVQINGVSILSNGVANIPVGSYNNFGVFKTSADYGITYLQDYGILMLVTPSDSEIKTGTNTYKTNKISQQHISTFYGLAKAAGDSTQSASSNAVGIYTDDAKSAIQAMLSVIPEPATEGTNGQVLTTDGNGGRSWTTVSGGGSVNDVQVNGTSVVTSGTANIPVADSNTLGVIKRGPGLYIDNGVLGVNAASSTNIKEGTVVAYVPVSKQHELVFYGLAKAAGDSTQPASSNAVGTYTSEAQASILSMLGIDSLIGSVESDSTADQAYAIGDLFVYNGKLYKATAAITSGGTITPNTNCTETNIITELVARSSIAPAAGVSF